MKLSLETIPFSYRGSYLAISYLTRGKHGKAIVPETGYYLKTMHHFWTKDPLVAKLTILANQKPVEPTCEFSESLLVFHYEDASIQLVFADNQTLLIKSSSNKLSLELDFLSDTYEYNYLFEQDVCRYFANVSRNFEQFCLTLYQGYGEIEQDWDGKGVTNCRFRAIPEENGFYLGLQELNFDEHEDTLPSIAPDFQEQQERRQSEFQEFYQKLPEIDEKWQKSQRFCAYVNWSSFVAPNGRLAREGMLMSKNWMANIWSWDHCFNSLLLAERFPEEAWNQFMLPFDYQEASGKLPDLINDGLKVNNFVKPPIHGWVFSKLRKKMALSPDQLLEAYHKLAKWSDWWLKERCQNPYRLCQYQHGCDSGWDNATVFLNSPVMISPDASALLILQLEELSELANLMGYYDQATYWSKTAAELLACLIDTLFINQRPVVLNPLTGQTTSCQSLLPYITLILGKRLPTELSTALVKQVRNEGFWTECGLATEAIGSPHYDVAGYWRGPIWAPSTYLIVDGLFSLGEKSMAHQIAIQFCKIVAENGPAENFHPTTGQAQSDPAYTWTASIMQLLAHEYLYEK